MVLVAIFALLVCQLAGELLARVLHLPVPGPVLGMLLLAGFYAGRGRTPGRPMRYAAGGLLQWLGLLFVPAGVGIFTNLGLLRTAWLPLLAGLVGSTLLTLLVTAVLMHWTTRGQARRQA